MLIADFLPALRTKGRDTELAADRVDGAAARQPVRIKICGITRLDDARLAIELGASALGFTFYPPSPRYIEPEAASAIIAQLPPFIASVGVFADEPDATRVIAAARRARVSAVQLHGPRFPDDRVALGEFPVIRAVPLCDGFNLEDMAKLNAQAFLLDSFDPKLIGGTGKTVDWNLARQAKRYGTIILAGGLTPGNVSRAIREVQPFAVDVASGVESAPGRKDPEKLRAFFNAVMRIDEDWGG